MSGLNSKTLLDLLLEAKGPRWVLRQLAEYSAEPHWVFSRGDHVDHRPFLFITGPEAESALKAISPLTVDGESDE